MAIRVAVLAVCLQLSVGSAVAQTSTYSVRDLGISVEGAFSNGFPEAINNKGHVVGGAGDHPFLWTPEGGLELFLGNVTGWASDINNAGQVVGFYRIHDQVQGFIWSPREGLTVLPTFIPSAINDHGQLAGQCVTEFDQVKACSSDNGTITVLDDSLGGGAWDINNAGDIVGQGANGSFLWTSSHGKTDIVMGHVSGINSHGEAAGDWFGVSGGLSAAVWLEGNRRTPETTDITDGEGINERGWVAGLNWTTARGFLWLPDGRFIDLPNLPGGTFGQAYAINDHGVIVGVASGPGGFGRAVMWSPQSERLRVTTPNTPSRWGISTRQRLSWTYTGTATQFAIDFSPEPDTWIQIDTVDNLPGNSQNYYREVTAPPTTTGRLRVRALGDPAAVDVNDADITIAPASIGIIDPRPSSTRTFGSTERIFYTHNLGARAPVAIDVSGDNGRTWRTVAARAETNGSTTASFYWTVDLTPTTQARVRVRALDGSGAVGVSAAFAVNTAAAGTVSY